MSEIIKKGIEEFQKTNGNANFTIKEMMQYQITRLDKIESRLVAIDDRFETGTGKIATNKAEISSLRNVFTKVMMIGIPILSTILGWIIVTIIGILSKGVK